MKLIGHTYDCNSLTNFEYEVNEMTGNGSNVNLLKKMADFGRCEKGMGFMIALHTVSFD